MSDCLLGALQQRARSTHRFGHLPDPARALPPCRPCVGPGQGLLSQPSASVPPCHLGLRPQRIVAVARPPWPLLALRRRRLVPRRLHPPPVEVELATDPAPSFPLDLLLLRRYRTSVPTLPAGQQVRHLLPLPPAWGRQTTGPAYVPRVNPRRRRRRLPVATAGPCFLPEQRGTKALPLCPGGPSTGYTGAGSACDPGMASFRACGYRCQGAWLYGAMLPPVWSSQDSSASSSGEDSTPRRPTRRRLEW